MDIYIPAQTPHKQNIVVFLYGGALVASLASPLRFWTPAYEDIQMFLTEQQLDSDCNATR